MVGWIKRLKKKMKRRDVAGVREIFEKCLSRLPKSKIWLWYIKFEKENGEVELARHIFERFVECHSNSKAWILYAKFEEENREIVRARNVYEKAVDIIVFSEDLLLAFAEFEAEDNQPERARVIYKHLLDGVREERRYAIYKKLFIFEKQYGNSEQIDCALAGMRRIEYEEQLSKNPHDYDIWFDYLRLEESVGNRETIRDVYKRAIDIIPEREEKRYWQRYIYLWIKYALYEELEAKDVERTRQVYGGCLNLIPHKKFSFAKIWVLAAQFEIRLLNVKAARQILENAIDIAPKDKIFMKYIWIERRLANRDRCKKVYERYLLWSPKNCYAWMDYAQLVKFFNDPEGARDIFELAVNQPALDEPKLLWKEYIDFEVSEGEFERTRDLFERVLDKAKHLNVWIRYAKFEASAVKDCEGRDLAEQKKHCIQRVRSVFERAVNHFRTSAPELKDEISMLLEEWLKVECSFGKLGDVALVQSKLPVKLENRREIVTEYGPAARVVTTYPQNYKFVFDYIRRLESVGTMEMIRGAYKWAITMTPKVEDKQYWQRYIYLWIYYALYEELEAKDVEQTRQVYQGCLNLIPHKKFSFAKIWVLAAQFEIRQLNLKAARQILENAIGKASKDKIFKKYIEIELQLGNIGRCRKLYERYLVWSPENCYAWMKYAELERSLCEIEHVRAIFELAVKQPDLDEPELMWKEYIDFEISEGEFDRTRELYERLLDRTKHLKVWISYAKFEASAMKKDGGSWDLAEENILEHKKHCIQCARTVFKRAINHFRASAPELKEARAMLLEEWLKEESSFGKLGDVSLVQSKLPKKLKKRRRIVTEDGASEYVDYVDYMFPEETQHSESEDIQTKDFF